MGKVKEIWSIAEDVFRGFNPFYWQAMLTAAEEAGVSNNWFPLNMARGSYPEPVTLERFRAVNPYTAPEWFVERLDELAELGMLERVENTTYRLTDRGREVIESIFAAAHASMAAVEPLPAGDMERLNGLLWRLVEATLNAPEPEDKWNLVYSRWTDPGDDGPASAKLDQYLTDLYRYRDDAHIAAWKPYYVSGHVWEVLTFVWRGDASTAEELSERLSQYRSYTVVDYQEALKDLVSQGWLVEEDGAYKLTEEGKRVREEAEEATDRHHFASWSVLSKEELADLKDLLARASDALRDAAHVQMWEMARGVSQGINGATRDVVTPLLQEHNLDQPGSFYVLKSTQRLAPDRVSAARLSAYGYYNHPDRYQDFLDRVAEAGLIAPVGDGEYEPTDKGRASLETVEDVFYKRLGELDVLSAEELGRVETLLSGLVEACLNAEEPASRPAIAISHQGHPDQEYAPLAKIDQHLDDLTAFRDDAHVAAWKPYGVSGQVWEALTFVWRGDALTAEALAEQLPFRGYSADAYAKALKDLAGRGWVEKGADGYQVTDEGSALRQEAEDATDRYFFAPWASLTVLERIQLNRLLTQLRDGLQALAVDDADAA